MSRTALPARPEPVRLPKRFARHANHFVAYSPKAGRKLEFFSELEFDYWALRETDPEVLCLCSQPGPIIEGQLKGKKTAYVFDLWLLWKSAREEYVEVKPKEKLVPDETGALVPRKWSIGSKWCEEFKKDCRFVTEDDIYVDLLRVQNARRIAVWAAFAARYGDPDDRIKIAHALEQHGPITVAKLMDALPAIDATVVTACAADLACQGTVGINMLGKPFGRASVVELSHG